MSSPTPSANYGYVKRFKTYPPLSTQALHSSNIFLVEQIKDLRETEIDIQTELSRADNEIVQVQATLGQVMSERQRLHDSLTHYRSLLSPIRRLPSEILSEIFKALPREPGVPYGVSNTPILWTRICSRWRNVAILTPQLWNSIDFIVDEKLNVRPFTMETWKVWLSRSGACPLAIKVDFQRLQPSCFTYGPIVDMLTSCSCRWKEVNITAPFSSNRFAAVKGSLPILTDLVIASNETRPSTGILTAFEDAPRLKIATLKSNPLQFRLPWAQLQVFSTSHTSIKESLAILERCRNLRRCKLDSYEIAPSHFVPAPLMRSKLQELDISIPSESSCGYIFGSLICPALNHLSIQSHYLETLQWPQDQLSSFLARSSCVLRKLTLHDVSLNYPNLIRCLEELSSLIELDIGESTFPAHRVASTLFDRMTNNKRSVMGIQPALLVPKLKIFSLNINFAPDGDVLLEMIRSRWNFTQEDGVNRDAQKSPVARLESIRLTFGLETNSEKFARMQSWRDEGLDIQITIGGSHLL